MARYKFTEYFEKEVLRKRSYLKKEWCIRVLENPLRSEPQEGTRYRFWGQIEELEGRIMRIITLEAGLGFTTRFQTEGSSHEAQLLS